MGVIGVRVGGYPPCGCNNRVIPEDKKISQVSDRRETQIPLHAEGEETGARSANLRKAESVHPVFVKRHAH